MKAMSQILLYHLKILSQTGDVFIAFPNMGTFIGFYKITAVNGLNRETKTQTLRSSPSAKPSRSSHLKQARDLEGFQLN